MNEIDCANVIAEDEIEMKLILSDR